MREPLADALGYACGGRPPGAETRAGGLPKLGQPPAPPSRRRLALIYMGVLFGALVIYIVLALRGVV